ncbi:TonB-dependent receptor [Oleiharenicola lentus]|uniref:TonB-dependent receptor n=1 Tax=Oleiharenicola lentus TaxID=2508720 RepID=UPI003F6721C5
MNAQRVWSDPQRAGWNDFSKRLGLSALTLAWSAATWAQEAVTLDPLEITARRTETALANAPVAVTAYSGDFMAANGLNNYGELARVVPGLFVMEQSVDNVSLNLRGLNSDTGDPRLQPRISTFQDGVLLTNAHGNSVALFDVANVAVFKGPQATRFGRSVQGGALVLNSQRATNGNSGALALGFGGYQATSADVMVNRVVVADKLYARVAVHAKQREGYVTNLADDSKLQGEGTLALRASGRWQPTDATTVDVIFNYQRDDTPCIALKNASGVPGFAAFDIDPFNGTTTLNRGSELGVARTILGLTGIVAHTLSDAWVLTAISAWRDVESRNEFDIDGAPLYLLEAAEVFDGRQFSQELRFNYDRGGKFTGAVGTAIYATNDTQSAIIRSDENVLYRYLTRLAPPIAFNPRYAEQNSNEARNTTGDVFGRLSYQATERLTLGGGLRLTQESIKSRFQSYPAPVRGSLVGAVPTSGGMNNFFRNTNGWLEDSTRLNSWSGQLDARYMVTPQLTAYATLSRGRHAPVLDFNALTLAPQVHAEETVLAYEAGVKGAIPSRRLRYEASVFQYDFSHFQTQRTTTLGVIEAFDGGRARGRGVETTLQADLARALTVFATYGFTDAQFSDTDESGAPQVFAGNKFRLTSRHVVSLGGTATLAVEKQGMVFVTPLFTYRSEYFFEDNNAANGGILRQGGHALLSVRLGYRPRGGQWEVTAYATNLLDKDYLLDAGNIGGSYGLPTNIPAAPRMFGAKFAMRF